MSESLTPFTHSISGSSTPLHGLAHDPSNIPFSRPSSAGGHDAHQVGFVGLGAMGHFMAKNLAIHAQAHPAGSPPLVVWNRSVAKSEALLKEVGGHRVRIAQSPGEVARDCDIIVTNLASDEVVRDIYKKFAADLAVSRRRHFMESYDRI